MKTPKPQPPPLFMLVFISMFGFIGLAVLIFLWSQSRHEFGAPPLFFRLVGSCIALAFMAIGFGMPISALMERARPKDATGDPEEDSAQPPVKGYRCSHCGAGLGQQEVSPSGDVKCSYCQKWWNIHAAGE